MNPSHAVSRPAVVDTRSCEQWLAHAPLLDSRQACAAFVELLDELEDGGPAPAALLGILELLHRPMHRALRDQAHRFTLRALPLAAPEEAAFVQVCDLWLGLLRAWQKLRSAAEQEGQRLDYARALVALRTIETAAGLIQAHLSARRDVAPGMWRWLHQGYAYAERQRLAEAYVPARPGEPTTCQAAYAETLLLRLAHPYGLGARELAWTQRWASRWARKVQFWRAAENGGGPAVDLDGDAGPSWTAAGVPGGGMRFVDCSEVQRSVRRRLKKLQEGVSAAELGLGDDCVSPAVDDLLNALSRCWSDAPHARHYSRREAASRAEVAYGMEFIFATLQGRTVGKNDPWSYSRRATEELHVFQRAIEHENRRRLPENHEVWEIIDESADGFQLRRQSPENRLALRQLVALRAAGTQRFILCEVRWMRQGTARTISLGLLGLRGIPQVASFRADGDAGRARGWLPAFVLAGAAGTPPTLVLPPGLYGKDRQGELNLDQTVQRVRLCSLQRRGYDYDWAVFSGEN